MNQEQLKAMSNHIKKRRELFGYTQEQFAEMIELSASSYIKIENAYQKPSLDTLVRIYRTTGAMLSVLMDLRIQ